MPSRNHREGVPLIPECPRLPRQLCVNQSRRPYTRRTDLPLAPRELPSLVLPTSALSAQPPPTTCIFLLRFPQPLLGLFPHLHVGHPRPPPEPSSCPQCTGHPSPVPTGPASCCPTVPEAWQPRGDAGASSPTHRQASPKAGTTGFCICYSPWPMEVPRHNLGRKELASGLLSPGSRGCTWQLL